MWVRRVAGSFALALGSALPADAGAQSRRTLTVRVVSADSVAIADAVVRSDSMVVRTDASGTATLSLVAREHTVHVTRLGFAPESLVVALSRDTTVTLVLEARASRLSGVVVSATRSERRIEDDPLRVETLSEEEVEEKVRMTPGDITMMLNETSGLRVQTTSPSLGGANVRVQGLRGRYTQILVDGLPLHGGQTGGLGLLQIPPVDLGGVEVIKGVASALYGGSALGGVINLLSRRPGAERARQLLLNQTTMGGTDAVGFVASGGTAPRAIGYTMLAGVHRQRLNDVDSDGWTDVPGYERLVLRPRIFWTATGGNTAMITAGFTGEHRSGGSVRGATAPNGAPYPERLRTRRFDAGGVGRVLAGSTGIVTVRSSASLQRHRHTFGARLESDAHLTWFGEAAYTMTQGAQTWVIGAALQQERYEANDVSGFDFTFTTPGVFAQATLEPTTRIALTASGRVDRHSEYGTLASPRLSVLVRPAQRWSIRGSLGSGYFAPTPFTEETEVVGLTPLAVLRGLREERAQGGSIDIGAELGAVELNGTVFASRIHDPVAARDRTGAPFGVELVNLPEPTRTTGFEVLGRWEVEPFHATASYTHVHATEVDPLTGNRRTSPLTPRHQAGVVVALESEERGRIGLEIYYTGRQSLEDDAFRGESRPYTHIGILAERRFGPASVYVNAENLFDVRQTKHDPLVRPSPGLGGRWTNDVWAPLDGFVMNAGIRISAP
jgi:outer membrane receptor for ferrienterochelin and colicins